MMRFPRLLTLVAATSALMLVSADFADARSGRGGSFGSRGSRTFSAPPATQTAPRSAAPIERSITRPATPSAAQRGPAGAQPNRGFFGGGFGRGLLGGLIGAGLIGMLFGNGLFGGLGGLASILGLLLQIGLIFLVVRLVMNWFRRRQQPEMAGAGAGGPQRSERTMPGAGGGFGGMFGGGAGAAAAGPVQTDIEITADDQDHFERSLREVQTAYGREDIAALKGLATPEMVANFSEELSDNASRGLVNETGDVKLLQGDLAEAWRENDVDYATVAMRFEMRDVVRERASGRVVDGEADGLIEATELWTFRRVPRGRWMLSAIQQA